MHEATGSNREVMMVLQDDDAVDGMGNERVRIGDLASRLKVILATEDRVDKAELRAMCEPCGDREFGLALHRACEQIRDESGVVFIPPRGEPGVLVRASSKQKLGRAATFRGTAVRKMKRAGAVLNAVKASELTSDDAQRLQMAQDKNAMMLARVAQVSSMRRPLPVEAPKMAPMPRRPQQG